jgi:PAS domain S-box-containing protein
MADTRKVLLERIRDLQERLDEAAETLRAIRSGEVDAIVASGPDGDRVYTLTGADEAYRVMVQGMAEGALTLTVDGLILFSNTQFATILGSPLERVIGSRIQDLVTPEDADAVSMLLSAKAARKAEVRLRTDGGALVPAYLSVQNLVLDGAERLCVVVTDLSAQKRYEDLFAVMQTVPAGIFIAQDAECRRIVGNRMAHELLRLPPASNASSSALELEKSKSWREVKDGRGIPTEELPMQTAARTGEPVYDYELDVVFDDGTCRRWLGNAVPLFNETLRSRGAVSAFVDITERKRAEEALEKSNAELRNFAYALTHDLREPLRMVVNFTQLLAKECEGKLGEDAPKYISYSVEGALRIEALHRALLDYWEITESGLGNISPVDCNQVLSQTLLNLQMEIQQSGAAVTSDPLPTVVAEEAMLGRVFQNLIGNAIRYRGEAAPRIHISAVRTAKEWLFSVRDKGVGIDPEDAEVVFGMFKRLHGSEIPGTGIGLALCKRMVERCGGRIWVESQAGKGADFKFTIPL